MEVPAVCKLAHKGYTLPNGAKLIVVTDPATTKSAAAMSINVGSHFDPPELPGLAHLCEHMLFLGTERNPKEGEYNAYVAEHGGHSNAWTEDGLTQYHFDVANAAFDEGLQIFLHFFVSPLFTASSLEREVKAVHSEDEKNHSSDYWCMDEIRKLHVANPAHPHSRYGNGNLKTLWTQPRERGVDVRGILLQFFERHYVANNACLAVYTDQPGDAILAKVAPVLLRMRAGPRTVDAFGDVAPYAPTRLLPNGGEGQWVVMQANRAVQSVSVNFPVPFSTDHFRTKPCGYASHVLGHECDGSLCGVLKAAGLAEGLSAGCGWGVDNQHDLFNVKVSLTAKGVREIDTVLDLVFQAIGLLRHHIGVRADLDEDNRRSHALAFNLSEISSPVNHVSWTLCRGGNVYGLEKAWSGGQLLFDRDDVASAKVMEYLNPRDAWFLLQLQDPAKAQTATDDPAAAALPTSRFPPCATPLTKKSEHHGAAWGRGAVPEAILQRWDAFVAPGAAVDPRLTAPKPNPYLVSDFTTVPLVAPGLLPTRHRAAHGAWYFKGDERFDVPKAAYSLSIMSPPAYASPRHRFLSRVAASVAKHALTEASYFAELAAITVNLVPDAHGLEMHVEGPKEKLWTFAEHALASVILRLDEVATEDVYLTYADKVRRDLKSNRKNQPYQLGMERSNHWTHLVRWHYEDVLAEGGGDGDDAAGGKSAPTFAEFVAFVRDSVLQTLRYDAMFTGNLTLAEAEGCVAALEKLLASRGVAPRTTLPKDRYVNLPPTRAELQQKLRDAAGGDAATATALPFATCVAARHANPQDPNWAVQLTVFVGVKAPRERALSDVLMAFLSSPFFDTLRTTEALGYIVSSGSRPNDDVATLLFIVQSAVQPANYLLARVYAFLTCVPAKVRALAAEKFSQLVQAQIALREDAPKSVAREAADLWSRSTNPFGFEARAQEVEALKALTLGDLVAFADAHLALDSPTARWLVAWTVAGNADDAAAGSAPAWNAAGGAIGHVVPLVPKVAPPPKAEGDEKDDDGGDEEASSEPTQDWALPTLEGEQPSLWLHTPTDLAAFRATSGPVIGHFCDPEA